MGLFEFFNSYDEEEKEEVRSGDYSPEDFGEEDLEEDDYYYEDDN